MSSEVHRYKVGDIGVTVLSDGFRVVPSLDGYILNAGKDELLATLAEAGLPTDPVRYVYNVALIETGGKRVLIDTGIGKARFQREVPTNQRRARTVAAQPGGGRRRS